MITGVLICHLKSADITAGNFTDIFSKPPSISLVTFNCPSLGSIAEANVA